MYVSSSWPQSFVVFLGAPPSDLHVVQSADKNSDSCFVIVIYLFLSASKWYSTVNLCSSHYWVVIKSIETVKWWLFQVFLLQKFFFVRKFWINEARSEQMLLMLSRFLNCEVRFQPMRARRCGDQITLCWETRVPQNNSDEDMHVTSAQHSTSDRGPNKAWLKTRK